MLIQKVKNYLSQNILNSRYNLFYQLECVVSMALVEHENDWLKMTK